MSFLYDLFVVISGRNVQAALKVSEAEISGCVNLYPVSFNNFSSVLSFLFFSPMDNELSNYILISSIKTISQPYLPYFDVF